ncbi:ExbD/TolR family protein [Thiomicrorhabdus cannonii]|uniref:ExbD/TolR family protein n=1 Tax=Thiomicrorhabdus cannonii TaxID=2748011 RepID=UPI0015BB3F58|nr:biopolymer transporter ExbD [Thiomicrorhabdus cannonii]
MAFGGLDGGSQRPMADINTTPLVDVMLVLLIIFIVTAPLMTQALKVDLPKANAQALQDDPQAVTLSIAAGGELHWNDIAISDDEQAKQIMSEAALATSPPAIRIEADKTLPYQRLTEVLSMLRAAGLNKVGFITQPAGAAGTAPAANSAKTESLQ